jgi:hypothetical protein
MTNALFTLGLGAFLLAMWDMHRVRYSRARWRDNELGVFSFMPTVKRIFDFTFLPVGIVAVVIGVARLIAALT